MAEEYFHDYTLATNFERFVATMEQTFRGWLFTGLENISRMPPALGPDKQPTGYVRIAADLPQRLPWRPTPYILSLHVPYTKEADLREQLARRRHDAANEERRHGRRHHKPQPQLQQAQPQKQPERLQQQERCGEVQQQQQRHRVQEQQPQEPEQQRPALQAEERQAQEQQRQPVQLQGEGDGEGDEADTAISPLRDGRPLQPAPAPGAAEAEPAPRSDEGHGLPAVRGGQESVSDAGSVPEMDLQDSRKSHPLCLSSSSSASTSPKRGAASDSEIDLTRPAAAAAAAAAAMATATAAAAARPAGPGLCSAGPSGGVSGIGTPASAHISAGGNGEELQQRLEDLLESFHETQKQLAQQEADLCAGTLAAAGGSDTFFSAAPDEAASGDSSATEAVSHVADGSGRGVEVAGRAAAAGMAAVKQPHGRLPSQLGSLARQASAASATDAAAAAAATTSAPSPAAAACDIGKASQAPKPPARRPLQQLSRRLSGGGAASDTGSAGAPESVGDDEATSSSVALPVPANELRPGGSGTAVAVVRANLQRDASSSAASRSWWPQLAAARGAAPRPPWWGAGAPQHKLQRWFGVDHFVLLQPRSYSKRLLDAAEASTLASAGALALPNSGVPWPFFLPVHDALRDAYLGCAQVGGCSVHFSTDSTHVSRLPRHLRDVDEQLAAFAAQLGPHSPAAAAACLAARSEAAGGPGGGGAGGSGGSREGGGGAGGGGGDGGDGYNVNLTLRSTYKLPELRLLTERADSSPRSEDGIDASAWDWDWSCPWSTWARQRDPIGLLELDVIWDRRPLPLTSAGAGGPGPVGPLTAGLAAARQQGMQGGRGGGAGAGEGSDGALLPGAADHWVVHVLERGLTDAPLREGHHLSLRSRERTRRHLSLQRGGADWLWTADLAHTVLQFGGSLSGVTPKPAGGRGAHRNPRGSADSGVDAAAAARSGSFSSPASRGGGGGGGPDPGSFSTMLSALLTARTAAQAAGTMFDLAGPEWWEAHGEPPPPAPPDGVMQGVLRDLFQPSARSKGAGDYVSLMRSSSGVGGGGAVAKAAADEQPEERRPVDRHGDGTGAEQQQQQQQALPRSAARDSLLGRLALHCLLFGNARAVALLWHRFTDEVRMRYWEGRALLPRMPSGAQHAGAGAPGGTGGAELLAGGPRGSPRERTGDGGDAVARRHAAVGGPPVPDYGSCLIHQKLQMLNICIFRHGARQQQRRGAGARGDGGGRGGAVAARALGRAASGASSAAAASDRADGWEGGWEGSDLDESLLASDQQQPEPVGELRQRRQQQQQEQRGASSGDAPSAARRRAVSSHPSSGAISTGANSDFLSLPSGDSPRSDGSGDEAEQAGPPQPPPSPPLPRSQQQRQADEEEEEDQFQDALEVSQDSGSAAGEPPGASSSSILQPAGGLAPSGCASPGASEGSGECGGEVGDSEDSVASAVPQGVLEVIWGQRLLRFPERPLKVPITQEPPFFTEDQHLEMEVAMAAAWGRPTESGEAVLDKMRMHQSRLLLSDMSAFKAANPGCCFEDFVRWYSPGDWTEAGQQQQQQQPGTGLVTASGPTGSGQLSGRMNGPCNPWRQLWASAAAVPAAAQAPLMNARSDGEKVLHYLETLPPGPLFDQLVAVAISEAAALLASCQGASIPAVARVVSQFRSTAAAALRRGGGGLAHALSAAAGGGGSGGGAVVAGDWGGGEQGFSDIELELLLAEFQYMEQAVVAAESLCRRLPGQAGLCARTMSCLINGVPPAAAAAAAAPGERRERRGRRRSRSAGGGGRRRGTGSDGDGDADDGGGAKGERMHALAGVAFMPVAEAEPPERLAIGGWLAQLAGHDHQSLALSAALNRGSAGRGSDGVGGGVALQQRLLSLQLGEPLHREWVLLCAPSGGTFSCGGGGSGGGMRRWSGGDSSSGPSNPGPPLGTAAGSVHVPQPPSRMYVQEADGEMRLAFTLVSQPGL